MSFIAFNILDLKYIHIITIFYFGVNYYIANIFTLFIYSKSPPHPSKVSESIKTKNAQLEFVQITILDYNDKYHTFPLSDIIFVRPGTKLI